MSDNHLSDFAIGAIFLAFCFVFCFVFAVSMCVLKRSGRPSENADKFHPQKCRHTICNKCPPPSVVRRGLKAVERFMFLHEQNSNVHSTLCRPSCSFCLEVFGCSALEHWTSRQGAARAHSSSPSASATAVAGRPVGLSASPSRSSSDSTSSSSSLSSSQSAPSPSFQTPKRSRTPSSPSTATFSPLVVAADPLIDLFLSNVKEFVASLGPNSPIRRPLVQALSKDLPFAFVSRFMPLAKRTFYRAKNEETTKTLVEFTDPISVHGVVGTTRDRKSAAKEEAVQFWYSSSTRTHRTNETGDRLDVYHCCLTRTEVFNNYVIWIAAKNNMPVVDSELKDKTFLTFPAELPADSCVGKSLFFQLRPVNVHFHEIVEASCPICRDGGNARTALENTWRDHEAACAGCVCDRKTCGCGEFVYCRCVSPTQTCPKWLQLLEEKEGLGGRVREWRESLRHLTSHQHTVFAQRQAFNQSRNNVGLRGFPTLIFVMDFSGYRKAYDRRSSLGDAFFAFQALHITVFSREDDQVARRNFDYFSPDENDYFFVRRSLLDLFGILRDEVKNECVEFWTDGGPKHFKTRRSIFFGVCELKSLFRCGRILWNFFASHHGKSICDAHAAHVKHVLHKLARAGVRSEGAEDFARAAEKVRRTRATSFKFLNKSNAFDVTSMQGIKSFHCFEVVLQPSDAQASILCKTLTTDGDGVVLVVTSSYSVDENGDASNLDVSRKQGRLEKEEVLQLSCIGTEVEVLYEVEFGDGVRESEWSVGVIKAYEKTQDENGIDVELVRVFYSKEKNDHLDEDEELTVNIADGNVRIRRRQRL